ncbi:DUF2852 domain-containing protein [Poseidonocella sedimentorum]|uniref:DUF2852 domain-containing protein n=1 Tax=Poseidonocella sedimentorum TaxID=871652 RepID=A0A1I6DEY0_9RHOB|nr:DUF2852 domain-containing protein [Poseidonocella sedimentorum]SFR03957.1 Protein of unknown function [Poseidonocella sedimentorum]
MTPALQTPVSDRPTGWFSKAEAWLDSKGKGAWIAAMVLGFVFFWPVGLALLFYMIWSKDMFKKSRRSTSSRLHGAGVVFKPSGNSAFDSYKADTLQRLQDEQRQFEEFLERLRDAKDKAEFDQFMDDRRASATRPVQDDDAPQRDA